MCWFISHLCAFNLYQLFQQHIHCHHNFLVVVLPGCIINVVRYCARERTILWTKCAVKLKSFLEQWKSPEAFHVSVLYGEAYTETFLVFNRLRNIAKQKQIVSITAHIPRYLPQNPKDKPLPITPNNVGGAVFKVVTMFLRYHYGKSGGSTSDLAKLSQKEIFWPVQRT